MATRVNDVLDNPLGSVAELRHPNRRPYVLSQLRLTEVTKKAVAVAAEFRPWKALAEHDYPCEQARIVMSTGQIPQAYPLGPETRHWEHRNPVGSEYSGALCLWYPHDPPALKWHLEDPFDEYLEIAARHLFAEEYHRRHGVWPIEDTPHGLHQSGSTFKIRSTEMRMAVRGLTHR